MACSCKPNRGEETSDFGGLCGGKGGKMVRLARVAVALSLCVALSGALVIPAASPSVYWEGRTQLFDDQAVGKTCRFLL